MLGKRLLSLIMAAAVSAIVVPAYAAQTSKRDIKARMAEIEAKASEEGVVLDEAVPYEFDPDATQEPFSDEPIVHEEIIDEFKGFHGLSDLETDSGDESDLSSDNSNTNRKEAQRSDINYSEIWDSMCAESFGDNYLMPYKVNSSSQSISGNTNHLSIKETDLHLAGKNGLDVNIAREYNNQGYRYSYFGGSGSQPFSTDRRCYGFNNNSTGQKLYIMFLTEDDFYEYAINGLTISSLPTAVTTKMYNGSTLNCYTYEDISARISTSGISLSYDSSITQCYYTFNGYTSHKISYTRLALNDTSLSYGWRLMIPEIYLWEYDRDNDLSGNPQTFCNYYLGTFRDFNGETYSLSGSDTLRDKNVSGNHVYTYTSNFASKNNSYLTYEGFYADQTIPGTNVTYNFAVYDSRGKTYYFQNTGITGEGDVNSNARISIKAVSDRYGNVIKYEYTDNTLSELSKIIDTYGREINIDPIIENNERTGKRISYYDSSEGEEKEIVYEWATMPPSTLNNDSPIKEKNVLRFKVTNAEGEETLYDERETETFAYYKSGADGSMLARPNIASYTEFDTSKAYNIERIIYPTGAESRYKYRKIYRPNTSTGIAQELYAVENAYDIIENTVSNSRQYSLSNNLMVITKLENNISSGLTTKSVYNSKSLLTSTTESQSGNVSGIYRKVTNTYDDYAKLTKQEISENGIANTTEYTYSGFYTFETPTSIKTDRSRVNYTYKAINGRQTNIPTTITYQEKTGQYSYSTDYSISNTVNDNGSITLTKKIKDNSIKSQTQYGYDSSGRTILTRQWDKDSNSDGVLDENDDTIDKVVSYIDTDVYSLGALVTVSDIYDYDGNEEDSLCELYNINVYGDLTKKDDTYRAITTVEYDALSRPTRYTYPNGAERTVVYNTAGKNTTITDEAGTQYKNTYDGFGRLTHKHFNDNGFWKPLLRYSYDAAGRVAYCDKFSAPGQYTREAYTYDILDRISAKQVYNGSSTLLYTENYSYAVQNEQQVITKTTAATDNASAATETEYYDKYGRLMKKQAASGSTVIANEYTYDYKDNMLTETDAMGNTTTYEYDSNDLLSKKTLPDGHIYMWVYDMLGRAKQSFDSAPFAFTWYKYDSLNREIWRKEPFGIKYSQTKTYFDANSNVIRKLSQNNADDNTSEDSFAETLYTYDNMNNLIGETSNTGTRTEAVQYWYDDASRVIAMKTGLSSINPASAVPISGAVTKYEYDKLGYVTKETDALGNYSTFENDYLGNVLEGTDRNGNDIWNEYGAFGITYSYVADADTADEQYYTYNNLGRQTQKLHSNNGLDYLNYTYDDFGRIISEAGDTYENIYTYDLNSNVASYTLKEGNTTKSSESYSYDETNHLTSQNINGKIITYSYSDGLMTQKNVDGISTHITYNDAILPTGYTTSKNNTTYSSYTYTYRLDGNRIGETDSVNNRTRAYTYDNIGRLTGETISGDIDLNMTYAYDMRGNRTSKAVTGDENYTVASTYDNNNRLTKQTKSVGGSQTDSTQYYYDNNGNQTFKQHFTYSTGELMSMSVGTESDDIESFTYNARNQLTGYTKGSTNASYTYGANGLRKSKTVGSSTTGFVWNGSNLSAEKISGSIQNIYSYGTDGIAISKRGSSLSYYLKDAHGNVVGTTSESGNITQPYSYDAFGNHLDPPSATDLNPFRYCGEYYDKETGNIYLRARYYDSENGHFISEDPIKDGLNWYSYCTGNPINAIDPTGLDVYYFVNSDFENQAKKDAETLKDEYDEPIHIKVVKSKQEFIDEWNWMGYCDGQQVDVSLVVINMHGDPYSIFPTRNEEERITPDDLKSKNIGGIILLTCNSGHLDHKYTNFADQMLVKNSVGFVVAADGTVTQANYGWVWYDGGIKYTTVSNAEFYRYNWSQPEKGKMYRGHSGFIKYTKNDRGELVLSTIDENNPKTALYITQLN